VIRKKAAFFSLSTLVVAAGVICLYVWIERQSPVYQDLTRDYTERLAAGHADLSRRPDPRLLALRDPLDPLANGGISALDLSLYGGRYYVYFGVAPFLTLLVPWFLLTGRHLAEPAAVAGYAAGGFLLSAGMILAVRRRYFPQGGRFAALLGLLLVGLATPVELLVRRPSVYELVIAAAWFHLALALACSYRALQAERRRGLWLGLASLALGLAVGSRASYALAAPFFLGWAGLLTAPRFGRVFTGRQWVWGGLLPLAVVGGALASFNWVRFGNPLEFGFHYQISEMDRSKVAVWAWGDFPYNLRQYFLRPWRLGRYFPFFLGERAGPLNALRDYSRTEFLYGSWPMIPALALLAAAPWALRRTGKLAWLALLAAGISALNYVALLGLAAGSFRYQADVLPAQLLVLAWTLVAVFGAQPRRGPLRWWTEVAAALLVGFSCLVTFFAQFALLDVFAATDPAAFQRLSRIFNAPVFWGEALLNHHPTMPRLTVRLPTEQYGNVEPLLVTGEYTLQDFLYFYYAGPGVLQLGFESIGHGGPVSRPIAVDYGAPHQLEIFYGSFLPAPGDPWLSALAPEDEALLRRTLVVKLDGQAVLDGWADFHPTKDLFYWGQSPDDAAFGRKFSGKILALGSAPLASDPSPERGDRLSYGAMHLALDVSALSPGSRVPLVSAGYAAQGSVIFLDRTGGDSFRVGLQASGRDAQTGPPLQLDPSRTHEAEIVFGSLLPPPGSVLWPDSVPPEERTRLKRQVLVRIDGHPALSLQQEVPETAPATMEVGKNGAGFSGVAAVFPGPVTLQNRDSVLETAHEFGRAAR
jgi:hypothetical protein